MTKKKKETKPQESKLQIKASAEFVLMASKFASKESTRYYLNGVHFEPHPSKKGIIIVATDGHRLASFYDESGYVKGEKSAIIKITPQLATALGQKKAVDFHQRGKISHVVQVANIDDSIDEIGACHLHTSHNPPIDGTFPDWRRVVPKTYCAIKRICFNQRYIDGFVRLLGKTAGVDAFFTGETEPTVFRSVKYPTFLGVLMPMRGNYNTPMPEWFE